VSSRIVRSGIVGARPAGDIGAKKEGKEKGKQDRIQTSRQRQKMRP